VVLCWGDIHYMSLLSCLESAVVFFALLPRLGSHGSASTTVDSFLVDPKSIAHQGINNPGAKEKINAKTRRVSVGA
jgi:hypothetical protein